MRQVGDRVAVLVDNGSGKLDPAWEGRPAELVVSNNPAAVFFTEDAQCARQPDPLTCTRILRWDAASRRMIASADLPRGGRTDGQKGVSSAKASAPQGGGRDVTSAGFLFPAGIYTANGQCNPNVGRLFKFTKTYSKEWEADGGDQIRKIVEIGPGKYLISEQSDFVEIDAPRNAPPNPVVDVKDERVSATAFRQTTFTRWDERTQRVVPGKTTTTFTFCRALQPHER